MRLPDRLAMQLQQGQCLCLAAVLGVSFQWHQLPLASASSMDEQALKSESASVTVSS